MAHVYELHLKRDDGQHIGILDKVSSFEYVIKYDDDGIGYGLFTLPGDMDLSLIGLLQGQPDRRIEVWRGTTDTRKRLESVCFIRYGSFTTFPDGVTEYMVGGPDQNDLLKRRIVYYRNNQAEASKLDYADDMMKEIVAENLGPSASPTVLSPAFDRDLTDWGLSIQADVTQGANIKMTFPYQRLDELLLDIANVSEEESVREDPPMGGAPSGRVRIYSSVVPVASNSFEFRTWANQPGKDRTSGDSRLIFSPERGNLNNPFLELDYNDEINYVLAAGQEMGLVRTWTEAQDSVRIQASAINLREGFIDARNAHAGELQSEANQMLREYRPIRRFTGEVVDTEWSRYGVHWNAGDRVIADYLGIQFPCFIASVHVRVDGDGRETIIGRLEWQE